MGLFDSLMSPNKVLSAWDKPNPSSDLLKQKSTLPLPVDTEPDPSLPMYLEKNYQPHYDAWKNSPSPETTGRLLKSIDPIINEAIRTYGSGSISSPTLRSKAKKLAIQAIKNYDPSRSKLRTHLLSQFQGLRRMAAKEDQILNVPEQVLLDLGSVREAENRLRDKFGRDPSDMELSDYTGLSSKRLEYIRNMSPSFAEGRLTRIDDEGTSLSQPAVEQTATSAGIKAWHDYVYHDLDPVDQMIMEHTLGMNGKKILSNQEVAKKLRLSPGAISQRKAKIQDKLDQQDSTGLF